MRVKDYLVRCTVLARQIVNRATVHEMRLFALDKSRKPRFLVSILTMKISRVFHEIRRERKNCMEAKQKPFNKYSLQEAYELLHLGNPITWDIPFKLIEPSAFFGEELRRIEAFDVKSSERGKEILIDAIL